MNYKTVFLILFFSIQAVSCVTNREQIFTHSPTELFSSTLLEEEKNKGILVNVHVIDFNGFSETITNKERLRQFERRSFLHPQQYRKILRVFRRTYSGNSISLITLYHDNGQIYRYLECLNGRASGNFREWHENGTLKIAATILAGNADVDDASIDSWTFEGDSIAWSSEGKKIGSFPYIKGLLHGNATTWYPSGDIERIIEFKEGKRDGIERYFRPAGSLIAESSYENDTLNGVSKKFWPSGALQYEEHFKNDRLLQGIYYEKSSKIAVSKVDNSEGVRSLYNDFHLIRQEEIHNGLPNGVIKLFSANGVLSQEYVEKEGKKEGKETLYYPENGSPKISIEWKKGVITGVVETWYLDGMTQNRREMKHNERDGMSMAWYRNGDLMFVEEYEKDSLKKGIYHKKGETAPCSFVENGKGTATIFDGDGRMVEKIVYHEGKPILDQ